MNLVKIYLFYELSHEEKLQKVFTIIVYQHMNITPHMMVRKS